MAKFAQYLGFFYFLLTLCCARNSKSVDIFFQYYVDLKKLFSPLLEGHGKPLWYRWKGKFVIYKFPHKHLRFSARATRQGAPPPGPPICTIL